MYLVILIFVGAITTVVLVEIGKHVFRWDFLIGTGEFLWNLLVMAVIAIPGWLFWTFWNWLFGDDNGSSRTRHRRGRRVETLDEARRRLTARQHKEGTERAGTQSRATDRRGRHSL